MDRQPNRNRTGTGSGPGIALVVVGEAAALAIAVQFEMPTSVFPLALVVACSFLTMYSSRVRRR